MKIDRRDLLKLGAAQFFTLALSNKAKSSEVELKLPEKKLGPSIFQGATDESKTQFSILINSEIKSEAYVTNDFGKIWRADKVDVITYPGHPKKILKAYFSKLNVDEVYYLNLLNLDTQEFIDSRQFKMLRLEKEEINFAICSCMDDRRHEPEIWRDIIKKEPDIIFFIGDFVYADSDHNGPATPAKLWSRFCDAREILDIFFNYKLIPILATWDDHDFGLNDSDSESYPYVSESQKNFQSFFAQDKSYCRYLIPGPGVSNAILINNQLFFLLDNRSYRKPKYANDRYAHWGREQEEWMLSLIKKNNGPSWVMNGSQIFPKRLFKESLSGSHPLQFNGFLNELKKLNSKVIFVSGDIHFSEISKIEKEACGYETYEITSSSIHSKSFPGVPDIMPNDRRIIGTGERNYVLIESIALGSGAKMNVKSIGAKGNNLFELNLTVQ